MKNIKMLALTFIAVAFGCTTKPKLPTDYPILGSGDLSAYRTPAAAKGDARGSAGEYDPGAPKGSSWSILYASAPNYRQIGKKILQTNDEKFRWEFGPMWYRGRLGKNQVKVFVVGQEGAQDENVSNRAFTGSTGTKTQKFLNHIGIFRSYLFMNTFVYTINGQLEDDPRFNYMEQGVGVSDPELSPIVRYRHRLFDNMILENPERISLFMGVGAGGKASLATWINARGGKCSVARDMDDCDTRGMKAFFSKGFTSSFDGTLIRADIKNEIKVVGVPHPGGASAMNGGAGALDNIVRGFKKAADKVGRWKQSNPQWLVGDSEFNDDPLTPEQRMTAMLGNYPYRDAAIPHRDFSFGTNFRMGEDGTTSNRWKADSIQVFSKNGVYGDKSANYYKSDSLVGRYNFEQSNIISAGFQPGVDMPWEPPRFRKDGGADQLAFQYDYGPCGNQPPPCKFSQLLTEGWSEVKTAQSSSFGPTSIYRGNVENPEILVIADQTSHDDFFSGRALTGEVGQKLQTWLGANKNYLIIRTSPFDAMTAAGPLNQEVLAASLPHLKEVLAEVRPKAKRIVALGAWAQKVAQEIAGDIKVETADVAKLALTPIPRRDLPYHSRWWMGTSGNRAARGEGGGLKGTPDGVYHYYRVYAPDWNSKRDLIPPLSPDVESMIQLGFSQLK